MRAARRSKRRREREASEGESRPGRSARATSVGRVAAAVLLCGGFFLFAGFDRFPTRWSELSARFPFSHEISKSASNLALAAERLDSGDLEQAELLAGAELTATDVGVRAEAELIFTKAQMRRRRLDDAQRFAESARGSFEQAGDDLGRAESLRLLGQIVHDRGRRDWAARNYREALRLVRGEGAVDEEIALLVDLAILRGEEGALQDARGMLEEALYQARRHESPRGAEILGNLAETLRRAGELSTAARRFEQAHEIFQERGDVRGRAWASLGLGDVRRALGELEESAQAYDEARRLFAATDPAGVAWALHGQGALRLLRGDLTASRVALEESLRLHDERREARWSALVRLTLAELALAEGRAREAADFAAAAARRLQADGRLDDAARGWALGALARLDEGDVEAACLLVSRTIDARRSEDLAVRFTALHAGARCAAAVGDASAEDLARRMLVQARSAGHLAAQFEARLLLLELASNTDERSLRAAVLAEDAAASGFSLTGRRASSIGRAEGPSDP